MTNLKSPVRRMQMIYTHRKICSLWLFTQIPSSYNTSKHQS